MEVALGSGCRRHHLRGFSLLAGPATVRVQGVETTRQIPPLFSLACGCSWLTDLPVPVPFCHSACPSSGTSSMPRASWLAPRLSLGSCCLTPWQSMPATL